MAWSQEFRDAAVEWLIAMAFFLTLFAMCSGCASVEAGDLVPDYFELHAGTSSTEFDHPRPLLDGVDANGTALGFTLGWSLTSPPVQPPPPEVDLSAVEERLAAIQSAAEALLPVYGPEVPPTGSPGESWVVEGVSGAGALLALVLGLLWKFGLLPGMDEKKSEG